MNIEFANACYTGGEIYTYYGRVDGKYFLSDDDGSGIYLDTFPVIDNDETFTPEWQEKHSISEINNFKEFQIVVLDWILTFEPKGNYQREELKHRINNLIEGKE